MLTCPHAATIFLLIIAPTFLLPRSECCYRRGNKMRCRGNKGVRALLDGGDRLVHLERLGDHNAALRAELVVAQAAMGAGSKKGDASVTHSDHSDIVTTPRLQLGGQRARPRGWYGDRRGAQGQRDD
jgi:hypothetical protein